MGLGRFGFGFFNFWLFLHDCVAFSPWLSFAQAGPFSLVDHLNTVCDAQLQVLKLGGHGWFQPLLQLKHGTGE